VVLLNYLLPRDVLKAMAARAGHRPDGGAAAVHPAHAAGLAGGHRRAPALLRQHRRAHAARDADQLLRQRVPKAKPFLMYGLTEAFRSTYLPPEEVDRRPDSIGKAIPNAEILVLREDGSECAADEPGELVHRGALVGLGYWNDPRRPPSATSCCPGGGRRAAAARVRGVLRRHRARDAEGFLYFIGRRDEMMKTSGYRVSPTEVEEVLYATRLVGECVAFGVDHPTLGQAIQVIADGSAARVQALQAQCRIHMPAYMVPAGCLAGAASDRTPAAERLHGAATSASLPGCSTFSTTRAAACATPNGKIDRKRSS
jgi:acyl-CoA synthetase (AMP-forming)/AMP-acid ligase II